MTDLPSNLANMLREMANPQRTDEAQRNPGPLLLRAADEIERLHAALEDIGGFDCEAYTKHIQEQGCGLCRSCVARKALYGETNPRSAE